MTSRIEAVSIGSKASNNNVANKHDEKSILMTALPLSTEKPRNDAPNTARCFRILYLVTAWWKEILSLLVAVGALVAIAVILVMYNGQEQPSWRHSINLSTFVAILSTLIRALMVVVVEESKTIINILCSQPLLMHLSQSSANSNGCGTVAHDPYKI
jgi:Protein of unknown function (DUF3176)